MKLGFDRFDGPTSKPARGLDIKKNYLSIFPEFGDKAMTRGTDVVPLYEEGKPISRRTVTVLESKEVRDRHAAIKAELGLAGTGRNLKPITKVVEDKIVEENAVGDTKYYQEQLGKRDFSWDEL